MSRQSNAMHLSSDGTGAGELNRSFRLSVDGGRDAIHLVSVPTAGAVYGGNPTKNNSAIRAKDLHTSMHRSQETST